MTGDRKDAPYAAMCQAFRRSAVGCGVMSYRLFSSVRWPGPAEDVAAAVAWLKRNLPQRGGDPDRIYLFGHSAGCLLASLVAADPTYLAAHGLSPRQVAGVIAMGCRLNDRLDATGIPPERVRWHFETDPYERNFGNLQVRNRAVPLAHVGPHLPPTLVLIAETEQIEPPLLADANEFSKAAAQDGVAVRVEILKDRTHLSAVQKMTTPEDPVLRRIVAFVRSGRP